MPLISDIVQTPIPEPESTTATLAKEMCDVIRKQGGCVYAQPQLRILLLTGAEHHELVAFGDALSYAIEKEWLVQTEAGYQLTDTAPEA